MAVERRLRPTSCDRPAGQEEQRTRRREVASSVALLTTGPLSAPSGTAKVLQPGLQARGQGGHVPMETVTAFAVGTVGLKDTTPVIARSQNRRGNASSVAVTNTCKRTAPRRTVGSRVDAEEATRNVQDQQPPRRPLAAGLHPSSCRGTSSSQLSSTRTATAMHRQSPCP